MEVPLVILLGAARSGTTLLAEHLLSRHPAITYWSEPDHVWNFGNLYADSDRRVAADADGRTRSEIRDQFETYFRKHPGECLLEKTPANCLRVPFIREIFPEARFIHLVRDGRDVATSAAREWRGGGDGDDRPLPARFIELARGLVRQAVIRGMSSSLRLSQLPYYLGRLVAIVRSRLFGHEQIWGPQVPNLGEIRRRHSLLETCALQWSKCVETAVTDLQEVEAEDWMQLRYEDLLADPEGEIERIFGFLDLPVADEVREQIGQIDSSNTEKWCDALSHSERRALEDVVGETLERFDYQVHR